MTPAQTPDAPQRLSVGVHQARIVIVVAAIFGILLGIAEATLEYFDLQDKLFETADQVARAVQNTATESVIYGDERISRQVTQGLLNFKAIIQVDLIGPGDELVSRAVRKDGNGAPSWLHFLLPSTERVIIIDLNPLADPDIKVGELRVTTTSERAAEIWISQVSLFLGTVLLGTAILAGTLLLLSHRYIARPMLQLTDAFRRMDVEDPTNSPLPDPEDFRFAEFREIAESGARLMRDIARNTEVRDLTSNELFRSQKRFQDFAEISSDWFWETDRNGGITYISASFTKTLNKKTSEIYGRTFAETAAEDIKNAKWHEFFAIQEQRRQFRDFRYDIEIDAGQKKTLSINGRPFYDEDGKYIGYRGTGADVTNERLISEARNEALQRAEQASRTKSEFLATMSHEFRTPLNAIIGFSSLLAMPQTRKATAERVADYANAIQDSGQHMLELVNDILDISAIEAGKRELTLENVGLDELFSHSLALVERQSQAKNLTIETRQETASGTMFTDERSIRQILLNLLSNAIKFTPSGGSVFVSAVEDGMDIVFEVRDTGIGIEPERLPKIAEPFSHSAIHPHVAKEGTGLGLSIVRSLSALLDGDFRIESEVGTGTVVTVRLPRHASPEIGTRAAS